MIGPTGMRLSRWLATTFTLLGVVGCSDDDEAVPAGPNGFSNVVETRWVYQRVDSLSGITDTLFVSVAGETPGPNGRPAILWNVRTPRGPVTQDTVWAQDDTAVVQRTRYRGHHFFRTAFVLPFTVGQTWTSARTGGMTTVLRDSTVYPLPNGGAIWKAYLLEERWVSGASSGVIRTWMTRRIGIHHIHVIEQGTAPLNQTWKLIDFYDPESIDRVR